MMARTKGVKHGCVLAPTLSNLTFSAILMNAHHNECPGICTAYRTDEHLLNSRRMQASTRLLTTTVHVLIFVDDWTLNTTTEENRQRSMGLFAVGCATFGQNINIDKTVIMHQPLPNAASSVPHIHVGSIERRNTDNFACLDCPLSHCIKVVDEVAYQTSKAPQAIGQLQSSLSKRHGLHLNTK
ncbi:hypothetical protein SprV_0602171000 [Sparganum proliferum]